LHASLGLLWLLFTVAQIAVRCPRAHVLRRLNRFGLAFALLLTAVKEMKR